MTTLLLTKVFGISQILIRICLNFFKLTEKKSRTKAEGGYIFAIQTLITKYKCHHQGVKKTNTWCGHYYSCKKCNLTFSPNLSSIVPTCSPVVNDSYKKSSEIYKSTSSAIKDKFDRIRLEDFEDLDLHDIELLGL